MSELASLYYPSSQCVNPASLKQLLLVFDRVSFVDPVDDAQWRTKLFRDLERHDNQFKSYRAINSALPELLDHGCISRIDPKPFTSSENTLATASALSDLQDLKWVSFASDPRKFRMPSIEISGRPSWQVFFPKLPEDFIEVLMEAPEFRSHLLVEGDCLSSWSLSYAAGSAIGIALHLEIAESLALAPVTDSELHHRLLLMKLARKEKDPDKSLPLPEDAVRVLTTKIASTVLKQVLPEERLRNVSFREIIQFRSETAALRQQFIADIEARLGEARSASDSREWIYAGDQVLRGLQKEVRGFQAEFIATRDKVWPGIVSSANNVLVSGSLGAVAMSYIGGPGKALLGSIVGAGIGMLKTTLDLRAEARKLTNSSAPSIAYLSQVSRQMNS
jgi:hypothetical protein